MNLIVKLKFGSHLYGTNTENSDLDIKGVYLPSKSDCILGKVKKSINYSTGNPNSKNSKEDKDYEYYSLQYFLLTLGRNGDTSFLDMIHAPTEMTLETSDTWKFLQQNRSKFYTKNLKSYIGYCRNQAAKYGIKGSKLEEAKRILEILKFEPNGQKLGTVFNKLPTSEYSKKYTLENCQNKDKGCFDFCGKKLMADTPILFVKETLQKFYDSYGQRAKLAENNEGIDWKAISHAFRVGYQLKEIYETGDLIFPLKEKDYLREVKLGRLHYIKDNIGIKLEELISSIEALSKKSNYKESVDISEWEEYIVNLYR